MIPGGATDLARINGGADLQMQLNVLLAGQRVDVVLFALTSSLGNLACNVAETEAEAGTFASTVLGDMLNYVALNYADARAQIAIARQQAATNSGARQRQ